jgi:hypothetical protein
LSLLKFAHLVITITIANPSDLNLVQEVLHDDLKILHCDLVDMENLNHKIQEGIKF